MSFGTRLKERREALGITQPQLAKILGVSKGAIGNYETDVNSPRATILYELFDILKCDANYLFQDEMNDLYRDSATPEEFETLIKKYRSLDQYGQKTVMTVLDRETGRVQAMQAEIEQLERRIEAAEANENTSESENYRYPYLHRIACAGTGFLFDDIPIDTIEVPYVDGADFVVGVNGDSMEPDYYNGELLYVKKSDWLNIGDIGIFTVRNECYVKEFGEYGLISHNKNYDDIPGDEDVRIIGKVIGKVPDDYV